MKPFPGQKIVHHIGNQYLQPRSVLSCPTHSLSERPSPRRHIMVLPTLSFHELWNLQYQSDVGTWAHVQTVSCLVLRSKQYTHIK